MAREVTFILSLVSAIVFIVCQQGNQSFFGIEGPPPFMQYLMSFPTGAFTFVWQTLQFSNLELVDKTPEQNSKYDFIVIGAGSAGATIASRLSEIRDCTVLLIEAGNSETLMMDIPLLVNTLQFSNNINWNYRTEESDKYCLGMIDRRCNFPRGKVVGGSSVLNYMIATRGDPRDYDFWETLGNYGWSYKEVLYYFKKLENIGIPELRNDTEMHNTKGPMDINYSPYHTPLAEGFLKAGQEMGYSTIDYNGKERIGFSFPQTTTKNGERTSSNRAYLHAAKNRLNLVLTKNSLAEKILIDSKTKKALGVQFNKMGKSIRVWAKKEVIVCAGAIGSPQLLMLSGIGHKDHLEEVGLNVIKDAPVGDNLMDHIAYGALVFLVDKPFAILPGEMMDLRNPYIRDYVNNRKGPITVPGCIEGIAFVDVDQPGSTESYPNIELMFIGTSIIAGGGYRQNMGMSDVMWDYHFKNIQGRHSWTVFPMLMRPKSRGIIRLKDKLPTTQPRIIPNYLADPEDVRLMIKGIRTVIELSKTKAMQELGSTLYDVPVKGCEELEYDSDYYWECAIRTFTFTIYHYSGTCKMGPESDPTAVVNPELKVRK